MFIAANNNRKRMREMFSLRRSTPRQSRDTTHADCLSEIAEDVVLMSPKVYESGIVTSLDLRLVDLYGDCAFESNDATPATAEHEIGY